MLTLDEAERRRSLYYCGVLEEIGRQFSSGGRGIDEAVDRFSRESENISDGWAWAAKNFRTNTPAAELCDRYGAASAGIGFRYFPRDLIIRWAGMAFHAARRLGLPSERQSLHLIYLARGYGLVGDSMQASYTLDESARLAAISHPGDQRLAASIADVFAGILLLDEAWERAAAQAQYGLSLVNGGDGHLKFSLLWHLGEAMRGLDLLNEAFHPYHVAATCALALGDRALEAMAAGGMGLPLMQNGARWPGWFLLRRARRLAAKTKDLHAVAYVDYADAMSELSRGNLERAADLLERLIAFAGGNGYWYIGNVAARELMRLAGKPEVNLEPAVVYYTLDHVRFAGDKRAEAHKLAQLGDYYFYRSGGEGTEDGPRKAAAGAYKLALQIAHELHDADLVVRIIAGLTAVCFGRGDHKQVVQLAVLEMPNLEVAADPRYLIEVRKRLGDSYRAMGRHSEAKAEYISALATAKRVGDRDWQGQIAGALASM